MKILLTGGDGQIGWELRHTLASAATVIAPDRRQLDLSRLASIAECMREVRPDLVINAGGYTAVDRAEEEPPLAALINGEAAGVLAAEARACGAPLIHYSTDYIFDGAKQTPYQPEDAPNPVSAYGRSKLLGEQAIGSSGAEALILRLSWVYGLRRNNFLRAILEQAESRNRLKVVNDQHGCPTWCRLVAQWTAHIIRHSFRAGPGGATFNGDAGIYHLSCSGRTTWYGFARRIIELAELDHAVEITPCGTDEFPRPARRPKQSALDCQRTCRTFELELTAWDDALAQVMAERRSERAALRTGPAAQRA